MVGELREGGPLIPPASVCACLYVCARALSLVTLSISVLGAWEMSGSLPNPMKQLRC